MTRDTQTPHLSRRAVLAVLGTAGVGTATGAALGTTAFFGDRTTVSGAGRAGDLDLKLDYRATFAPDQDGAARAARLVDSGAARAVPGSDAVLVGELPALSSDADGIVAGDGGTALSGPAWTAFTTEYDACENLEGLPYVDGVSQLAFGLDGVRPHDAGEVTLSVHVCGNPAYLWLRAVGLADDENGLADGESDLPDRDGGELDDYTWIRLWYDTDCSNTFGDREVRLYQGSLAGLHARLRDGYPLDPVRDAHRDGGRGDGHLPDGCVVVPGSPKCVDYGLSQALEIESDDLATGDYLTDDGVVSVTVTSVRDGEPRRVTVAADFEFQGVILKGGNAATVCGYPDGTTRAADLEAPANASGRPSGISHLSVCVADGTPPDVPGICFEPGVHCLALEWYLPAFATGDDARPGFADLPSDALVPDLDGDGTVTLADELAGKGLAVEPFRAIDAVQGDTVSLRLDLAAVQCRHNTTNPNPFAGVAER